MSVTCWQHVVKQSKRRFEEAVLVADPSRVNIDEIDFVTADSFIADYEWLGNIGASCKQYALTYGPYIAAVVCYAPHTSPQAFATELGLRRTEVFQLCRGASTHWAPPNASSMIVARSLRLLEAQGNVRLVVAYADPEAGEVGTIYQAANAYYLGLTNSRGPGSYLINGKRIHARTVHRLYGSAKHETLLRIDASYKRFQRTKKHKYVFALGSVSQRRALIRKLEPLRKVFPKRGADAD